MPITRFDRLRFLGAAMLGAALLLLAGAAATQDQGPAEAEAEARRLLVAQIAAHAKLTAEHTGHPEIGGAVLEAIGTVPRHLYVQEEAARFAYLDVPLPAGNGLRESQPFIVALTTDLVAPPRDGSLLILGIGGGYHAAMASRLVAQVACLDLDAEAAGVAMGRLARHDIVNVETRIADPYYGWPEAERRFDAIIVRLAIDYVPATLLRQLKPGGRLVAPVGSAEAEQQLTLFTKAEDGTVTQRRVLPVRFMRLPGGQRI